MSESEFNSSLSTQLSRRFTLAGMQTRLCSASQPIYVGRANQAPTEDRLRMTGVPVAHFPLHFRLCILPLSMMQISQANIQFLLVHDDVSSADRCHHIASTRCALSFPIATSGPVCPSRRARIPRLQVPHTVNWYHDACQCCPM